MMRLVVLLVTCPLMAASAPATPTNAPSPAALSNAVSLVLTNVALETEYQRLMDLDDAAAEEVDRVIQEEHAQSNQGGGIGDATLKLRIQQRLEPVQEAYRTFLQRHPDHARARLAYGSFLMDQGREEEAVEQMERSRKLDPSNPAAWNNLANYYSHAGPVQKAFDYYDQALKLNAQEPVYFQNLATAVFLFRRDAMAHYQLTEPQVFEKSLDLYRQALKLAPTNFVLATDYAQSFYGIRPPEGADAATKAAEKRRLSAEAVVAWENALRIAPNDLEREGVHLHLARSQLNAGRPAAARTHLAQVTNAFYLEVKRRIQRNVEAAEKGVDPAPDPEPPAPGPPAR